MWEGELSEDTFIGLGMGAEWASRHFRLRRLYYNVPSVSAFVVQGAKDWVTSYAMKHDWLHRFVILHRGDVLLVSSW